MSTSDSVVSKSEFARWVMQREGTLKSFLANQVNPDAFISALVSEGNMLWISMSVDVRKDPRTYVSWGTACKNAATLGLIPGAVLGHCYFVPMTVDKNYPKKKHTSIQLWPGYRGLMELAFRNDFLARCSSEVILADETCNRGHKETGPWIEHIIPIQRSDVTRDTVLGAYCTYTTKHGATAVCVVTKKEIDKIDKHRDVWNSNYSAMCRKTAIIRASHEWQKSSVLSALLKLEEAVDADRPQPPIHPVDPNESQPESPDIDLAELGEVDEENDE